MNFQEFLIKWNGKYVDTDNAYGAQCMDLMHQYIVEVLGLSQSDLAAPSAKDAFNLNNKNFDKILNTPTGMPEEGDIIFWGNGAYGHVAIYIDGDLNGFNSFDQNYPTGSPCHVQGHNYNNVLGWMHPKIGVTVAVETSVFENLVRKSTITDKIAEKLNVEINESIILAELDKLIGYEDAVVQKDKQLQEAHTQTLELEKTNDEKEGELKKLQDKAKELSDEIFLAKADNKYQAKQIEQLKQDCKPAPTFSGWRQWVFELLQKI